MNTLLWSAVALASLPNSETPKDSALDWSTLDRDLASLSTALQEEPAGVKINGFVRTAYRTSDDIQIAPSGNDEGGFLMSHARLIFSGKIGIFELKASIEGTTGGVPGTVTVRDFYARWPVYQKIHGQLGTFKSPFITSGVASDDKTIFYDRTTQGELWRGREPGFMLDGVHGKFSWFASAQNGGDAAGDDLLLCGRASFAILGDVIPMKQTGGFGPEAPNRLQAAIAYLEDQSALTGTAAAGALEVVWIWRMLYVLGEVVDYDDGWVPGSIGTGNARNAAQANVADTTPFGLTVGVQFTEHDEVAVSYEDADDDFDSVEYRLGYNRYMQGHAAKWQINWISVDSDAGDVDEFLAGLTVSI